MKCPMLTVIEYINHQGRFCSTIDCLKEECAWWNTKMGTCAVLSMSGALVSLVVELSAIKAKMPLEAQFRK